MLIIGSVLGLLMASSLILFVLFSDKNEKPGRYLFVIFLVGLFLVFIPFIILPYFNYFSNSLEGLGLIGFFILSPAFFLFTISKVPEEFTLNQRKLLHFVPAILVLLIVVFPGMSWFSDWTRQLIHHFAILYFGGYLMMSINYFSSWKKQKNTKNQLRFYGVSLLVLLTALLLSRVLQIPLILGTAIYVIWLFISILIISNRGKIIDGTILKYQKTGLKLGEQKRIKEELDKLLIEEKYYTDNLVSLPKLAKKLNTHTHALSQVINEQYNMSFFDLISLLRIEDAKHKLKEDKKRKIAEIADEVGFNSISAFNTSFKKRTGLTPGAYRNE